LGFLSPKESEKTTRPVNLYEFSLARKGPEKVGRGFTSPELVHVTTVAAREREDPNADNVPQKTLIFLIHTK